MSVTPYYEDDAVTIYHGDCREIAPTLAFDVIVSDPPYGINYRTSASRGARCASRDWPPIHGDAEPFDPSWMLALSRPTVLFGANHYADRLPVSSMWIAWDKLDGLASDRSLGFNDQADIELIWTNLRGPARIIRQRWMGALKSGEDRQTPRRHPTEKPIELMRRLIEACPPGVVLDPYAGSGTTLRAAKDLGRRAIGIEIEERYCEIAARRMAQEVLAL